MLFLGDRWLTTNGTGDSRKGSTPLKMPPIGSGSAQVGIRVAAASPRKSAKKTSDADVRRPGAELQ